MYLTNPCFRFTSIQKPSLRNHGSASIKNNTDACGYFCGVENCFRYITPYRALDQAWRLGPDLLSSKFCLLCF